MSGVTDPYQPIERRIELTRGCLTVLAEFRNPVGVITKSALVTRDLDLLAELATHRCVSVTLSVTTLEEDVRRAMEPRASTAERRFEAIARLRDRGVPAGVNIAPVVPGLTDHEIVPILKQAAQAGAQFAHFIMLRLPYGVKDLFEAWLDAHFPDRKQKVLHRIRELRGGNLTTSTCGERMRGTGAGRRPSRPCFTRPARRSASHPQAQRSQPRRSGRPRDSPGCSGTLAQVKGTRRSTGFGWGEPLPGGARCFPLRTVRDQPRERRGQRSENPWLRQSCLTGRPASASPRNPMICASLNRFFTSDLPSG